MRAMLHATQTLHALRWWDGYGWRDARQTLPHVRSLVAALGEETAEAPTG